MDNTVLNYHLTFNTDSGRRVLAHILAESGYFDTELKTVEELAVLNFVKKIIKNLGVGITPEQTTEFVNKLFEISINRKESE